MKVDLVRLKQKPKSREAWGDVQARLDELTVPSGRERSLAKG